MYLDFCFTLYCYLGLVCSTKGSTILLDLLLYTHKHKHTFSSMICTSFAGYADSTALGLTCHACVVSHVRSRAETAQVLLVLVPLVLTNGEKLTRNAARCYWNPCHVRMWAFLHSVFNPGIIVSWDHSGKELFRICFGFLHWCQPVSAQPLSLCSY